MAKNIPYRLIVLVLSLLVLLIGSRCVFYCRFDLVRDLKYAYLSDEREQEFFTKISRFGKSDFYLCDKTMRKISSLSPNRDAAAYIVFLNFGEPPVVYKLRNPKNIGLLMRE